ncbi:MAG: hypothetical protein ACREQL_12320, partial [Candidatus Binatia bacterium]
FQTDTLEQLRRDGLEIPDTTLATIEVVQRRFFEGSPRLQRLVAKCRARGSRAPRVFAHGGRDAGTTDPAQWVRLAG